MSWSKKEIPTSQFCNVVNCRINNNVGRLKEVFYYDWSKYYFPFNSLLVII